MYPAERRTAILDAARSGNGLVAVSELTEQLGVTHETIRRDLDFLEKEGVLRRQHGGARLVRPVSFEESLAERQQSEGAEKRQIARAVIDMLPQDGIVLLDSGGLPLTIASMFPEGRNLLVVTNNLPATRILSKLRGIRVLGLPGHVRGVTKAAVHEWTRERIESLSVDLTILGTNGLTLAEGATTTVPAEAAVKRAMLNAARTVVLPLTASKIGVTSFCSFARADDFTSVVTDSRVSADHRAEFADAGMNLTIAPTEGATE